MANLMIVGADHLGNISEKLMNYGVKNILHIDGRKVKMIKQNIPDYVDVVFVMTDYINHNLAKVIKQKAKSQDVPTYFVKRSWCSIFPVLEKCDVLKKCSNEKRMVAK
ncbi:DUF2325 domain-containing protein [Calidifontibacillus erzurumensis]|uniref:DUF2325 domain-containing protein n=1 Tax=Calidifontibacillus erzurumensis TaxID=2741433 RepID=A0A8J8K9Y1_9BACI|nr:DUF2325 domain-containing protein [Calidifontibacillus erzurumensis]NSL50244.1 DUF2325 domain-containing protein [Calidifontibacillus erzurumensis]